MKNGVAKTSKILGIIVSVLIIAGLLVSPVRAYLDANYLTRKEAVEMQKDVVKIKTNVEWLVRYFKER